MNRLGGIALARMLAVAPAVAGQFSINPHDCDLYHDHQDDCSAYNRDRRS